MLPDPGSLADGTLFASSRGGAGELENTLILFLADNGGCAEKIDRGTPGALPGTPESFVSYGPPWANASNTPFRLYKHWEHEGNRAIRDGKWKLVSKHPGAWELYDLESDRTELNNLAPKFPEKARELAEKWERWAQRVGVHPWPIRSPAPTPNQKPEK